MLNCDNIHFSTSLARNVKFDTGLNDDFSCNAIPIFLSRGLTVAIFQSIAYSPWVSEMLTIFVISLIRYGASCFNTLAGNRVKIAEFLWHSHKN